MLWLVVAGVYNELENSDDKKDAVVEVAVEVTAVVVVGSAEIDGSKP